VTAHLVGPTASGPEAAALPDAVAERLRTGECFWLDLLDPSEADFDLLRHPFGFHPLAIEDARHGHQRPKIEEYDDDLFVVMQTLEASGEDIHVGEMDVFVGRNYLLSVRNQTARGFQGRARISVTWAGRFSGRRRISTTSAGSSRSATAETTDAPTSTRPARVGLTGRMR